MSDDTKSFLEIENKNKRQEEHENLIKQILKLKLITKTLLDIEIQDESVVRALKILRVQEYLHLGNDDTLLNLGELVKEVNLSYIALKTTREQLTKRLLERLTSVSLLFEKMEIDLPHLFEDNAEIYKLLELETERRKCYNELVEEQSKQMKLWKSVMDLKLGPRTVNELENLRAEMQFNQTKAELMADYIVNDMVTSNEHSLNAYKTILGFIDKKLDEEKNEQEEKEVQ